MIYTYNGIKLELKNRLALMSGWNKILYNSVYERIIDLLAYTGEQLVYIAEFLYRESKWFTASKRNSLVILARWLGYIPYRKSGAIGNLILSEDPVFNPLYVYTGLDISIPKWSEFTDNSGQLNVYTTENMVYKQNTVGNLTIPIKEGIPKQFTYIAKGEVNEKINIFSSNVDNSEIEIFIVNSTGVITHSVNIVNNLYLVNDTIPYSCTVENSSNYDYVIVEFGNGINSRKLSLNERVLIKYADTSGDKGNIFSSDTIIKIKTLLLNQINQKVDLYITNNEPITGGSNIEDIESIRNNAPNIFQIGGLLSSKDNWKAVINSAPYVQNSIVWSSDDLGGSILTSEQNIVFISGVNTSGNDLTASQKTDLEDNYIIFKKSLTESVQFQPLEKIYIRLDITAKIKSVPFTEVNGDILTTLINNYGVLNTDFYKNIYKSNYYNLLDSLPNIIYHNTIAYYLEKHIPYTANLVKLLPALTTADTLIEEDQILLLIDSFEIWIRRKIEGEWQSPLQIAETSGTNITGINGYTITGGFLNYTDCLYSFVVQDIANDPSSFGVEDPGEFNLNGYILYISYKMSDGTPDIKYTDSIRLGKFYQISDIDPEFIITDLSY